MSEPLQTLDRKWKATCRVLLGQEVGALLEFEKYLAHYAEPIFEKRSFISGKPTYVSLPNFHKGAKFISNDEAGEYCKSVSKMKFSPNDIKDIDSILQTFAGQAAYSGNLITGNSQFVEQSNSCVDSAFIFRSSDYYGASYIAYSSNGRFDECVFGCNYTGESKFIITSYDTYKLTRCLETLRTFTSSDCYYTANLEDCSGCLFSFNQRSKRNLIGNLALPKDEYAGLKTKLIAEMAETLQKKKALPSIIELIRD
ncbi:MAG: hypothetical protein NT051_02985 [Candidatus Micrarchaeota archaeon]|nr:hypothetical protein [Candidatus Micrarchaeota archaeon]